MNDVENDTENEHLLNGKTLSSSTINHLKTELISYVTAIGGNVMLENGNFTHAPMTLIPIRFPSGLFEFAKVLSPLFNKLVDNISRNLLIKNEKRLKTSLTWLEETLEPMTDSDLFTKRLLDIYKETLKLREEEPKEYQYLKLGIHRSDYMINQPIASEEEANSTQSNKYDLYQVELNTIASSFGSLATVISKGHKFLATKYEAQMKTLIAAANTDSENSQSDTSLKSQSSYDSFYHNSVSSVSRCITLPDNSPISNIANALSEAHLKWKNLLKLSRNVKNVSILMVVLEDERNMFDQRLLEYELYSKFGINLIRKTLKEIGERGEYVEVFRKKNILILDNTYISVVYFRAGYSPSHYKSEINWEGRTLLELSFSVKAPSIEYHLIGTKKVQQKLAKQGELEKFMTSDECHMLRKCFTGIYSLDENEMDEEDKQAELDAKDSEDYVLKPQREGGGNNFYGKDVGKMLASLSTKEKKSYVLMKRIHPMPSGVRLVRENKLSTGQGVSELGMFSVFLSDGNTEYINKYAGYLMRNKFKDVDEGGVATGYSCLGSVCLI